MIIQLDDKTRILGTETCWALQRLRTRKGEYDWQSYKYFTSFGRAVEEVVNREIRLHPAITFSEALHAVPEVIQRFNALIPTEYELRRKANSDGR